MPRKGKKLVTALVTSTLMTKKIKGAKKLEQVFCIWYSVTFKDQIKALLESKSEVNVMSQVFAHQLGLKIQKTNIGAQKIDDTTLETYGMVVSSFSILDKDGRERFFEESFLLIHLKPDVMLRMPCLTLSNTDINFQARDLQWRSYTTGDVLSTTKQVKLIGKKEFALVALNLEHETFIVHVAAFGLDSGDEVHPLKRTQIAHLKVDGALPKVPSEYADFADKFSPKFVLELSEHIRINNHAIELVDDRQPLYGPIYSLGLVELETSKAFVVCQPEKVLIPLRKDTISRLHCFSSRYLNGRRANQGHT